MLALGLDDEPDQQMLATVSAGAHALTSLLPTAASPTFSTGASVRYLFRWRQSFSTDCFPPRIPARRPVHAGRVAGTVRRRRRRRSTSASSGHAAPLDDGRDGPHAERGRVGNSPGGALRNGRRRGVDLEEQTRLANEALCGFSDDGDFVTGQVVRIDHASGIARIVNAGHPYRS